MHYKNEMNLAHVSYMQKSKIMSLKLFQGFRKITK